MTTILLIILGVLVLGVIFIYNSLVQLRARVQEAWSDITVQLKRRADLIPQLVDTVKGYAKHEKAVFENVTKARSETVNATEKGPQATGQAENVFQEALKSLFAVAEDYPDLKADQNFRHLQEELVDTEDKIQASRRFYNGSARDLNIKIDTFPNLLVAGPLGFKKWEFFEVDEAEKADIQKPVETKF
jgi:LemA protein